jgi:hypothetical protein
LKIEYLLKSLSAGVAVGRHGEVGLPRYFYGKYFKIDPPEADLKYSIFNQKFSIIS